MLVLVNGNWGSWSPWSFCSKTCGSGSQTRIRFCDSPALVNGRAACPGNASESQICNAQSCPANSTGNLKIARLIYAK